MKYLPSAKSPAWQMLFAAEFFTLTYLLITDGFTISTGSNTVGISASLGILAFVIIFLITAALSLVAVNNYNKKHPKSKVSVLQTTPAEFNDDDERLTGFTARATRNVYSYHNRALPIFALILLSTQPSLPTVVILLGILTMGHYTAYWIGIKPVLKD